MAPGQNKRWVRGHVPTVHHPGSRDSPQTVPSPPYLEGGGSLIYFCLSIATDQFLIISTAHATHFDTVVEVNGNTVKMTERPENLMFKG